MKMTISNERTAELDKIGKRMNEQFDALERYYCR